LQLGFVPENENDRAAARSHAVLAYRALVGAIGVARAVSDEQLSREILKTCRTLERTELIRAKILTGGADNKS
jgi:hypothetical protein